MTGTVERLRGVLPDRFELAYAVKANPALAVVAHLGSLGLGADVASGGELALVRRAGIDAANVVFTGPGKRDDELAAAVDAGLRAVTVESPGELARLEAISAARGRRTPVLLRMALGVGSPPEAVRIVGDAGAGKFGMDAEALGACALRAAHSPHLELLGLHAFGASNVLDARALAEHAATTMSAARDVAVATGIELRLIDMGGGLGIPYAAGTRSLDLAAFGAALRALDAKWSSDPITRTTRVIVEPGRYLVARAGALVSRVVDRKCADGATVVILDGGIHNVLRPALVGQEHRVVRARATAPAGARNGSSSPARSARASTSSRAGCDGRRRRWATPGGPRCRRLRLHRIRCPCSCPIRSRPRSRSGPGGRRSSGPAWSRPHGSSRRSCRPGETRSQGTVRTSNFVTTTVVGGSSLETSSSAYQPVPVSVAASVSSVTWTPLMSIVSLVDAPSACVTQMPSTVNGVAPGFALRAPCLRTSGGEPVALKGPSRRSIVQVASA